MGGSFQGSKLVPGLVSFRFVVYPMCTWDDPPSQYQKDFLVLKNEVKSPISIPLPCGYCLPITRLCNPDGDDAVVLLGGASQLKSTS